MRSLVLQGGPMTEEECRAFMSLPHAAAALQLRCWDDLAKDPLQPNQRLERFLPALNSCDRSRGARRERRHLASNT